MYKNNIVQKFYLFDFVRGAFVREFEDENTLLEFLVSGFYSDLNGRLHNRYFDNINMNGNDIEHCVLMQEEKTFIRRYMFIDDENRIVDVRNYKEKLLEKYTEQFYKNNNSNDNEDIQYGDVLYLWRGEYRFRYRIDPVPFVFKRHHGSIYRHIKTTQENRKNSDAECVDFVRAKRRHLPTLWDDKIRSHQKSWKKQSKKRKQWM